MNSQGVKMMSKDELTCAYTDAFLQVALLANVPVGRPMGRKHAMDLARGCERHMTLRAEMIGRGLPVMED